MFKLAYCDYCVEDKESEYKEICKDFVDKILQYLPELGKKLKVHLILHLVDDMMDFGPTSSFNTERYHRVIFLSNIVAIMYHCRCEAFNSLMRARNIFSNRLAPSRDIAHGFEVLENLRAVCAGNEFGSSKRYINIHAPSYCLWHQSLL